MKYLITFFVLFITVSVLAEPTLNYSDLNDDDFSLHVVDVGAGHCAIISAPGRNGTRRYMVFDTGKNKIAMSTIKKQIGNKPIDVFVVSHADYDHHKYAPDIVDNYEVKVLMRTGYERIDYGPSWESYKNYFNNLPASKTKIHINQNAEKTSITHDRKANIGDEFYVGNADITFVSGFGNKFPWAPVNKINERRNAVSIVLKIEYGGKSVLLTGDALGVDTEEDPEGKKAFATEKFMVENNNKVSIDSDILVAAHHGANNGSSTPFLEKVSPEIVIIPAGTAHGHPRKKAVERMIATNSVKKIYRTDYGNRESNKHDYNKKEWQFGNTESDQQVTDANGDDDVFIIITKDGKIKSGYTKQGAKPWVRD